jgi:hypothetical protein
MLAVHSAGLLLTLTGLALNALAAVPSARFDRFGGDLRMTREATGFFRFEQINGRDFFITPDGHPYVAIGANHMGPFLKTQAKETGLLARHGHDREKMATEFLTVLRDLGFTAGDTYQPEETYRTRLPWVTFFWYGPQNQTAIDVFDPAQLAQVTRLATAHARSVADNPWVLGIGGPDLQIWDGKLVRRYREQPPGSPGRQRYTAFLRERHGDDIARVNATYGTSYASFAELAAQPRLTYPADLADDALDPRVYRWRLPVPPDKSANPPAQADDDAFCVLVAETLFPAVRAAVKAGAPNHLFLGEHLALRMIPDPVLRVMGRYIDGYLTQAVEISPQRPPEWQIFQTAAWDREHALVGKPIIICDWGAIFSHGAPFDYRGGLIKSEKEASDDAAQFIADAFDRPYIVGLFLCKLLGNHRNDAQFFQDRATRTYMRGDGTPYPYRTERLRSANLAAQAAVFARLGSPLDR